MAKYHEVNDKILLELSRSRIAMIVEGISSQEYPSYLKGFETDLQRFGEPCLLDFLEEISEDPNNLSDKISGKELLLVYNLDLFGRDVDPKKATQGMEILQSEFNMVRNDIRHLILARPGGNLDYKSQKGYGYHSNHPLGNWAKFYGIENGKLVEQSDPIRHRE